MANNDDILPNWGSSTPLQVSIPGPDAGNVADSETPSFTNFVDPKDPESTGQPDAFSSLYAPTFYKGLIDAGTFLFDIPTQVLGTVAGTAAEALGFDELGRDLKNPVLTADIVKKGFEAPARIEEAITGACGWVYVWF